ncbi:MAG: hypothetical protein AB7P14_05920 [Blastocatellales bacterium]
MKIFSQLAAKSDDLTLRDACQIIARLVRDLKHGSSVWSLAELGADDDDLCWLIDWSSNLDAGMVRRWQLSPPHRAAFGSLLLLFASEYTRRCLPRDSDWFVPASILFSTQTRSELFDGDDLSAFHRQALIEAARKLRLRGACARNDLDHDCLRKLVFAQIGFTGKDITHRLSGWLMGIERPVVIKALLDPQTGSRLFQQFWESCRAYQDDSLSVEIFRQRLAESPWCLPQWIDPMVSALCAAQPPLPIALPVTSNALIQSSGKSQDIFAAVDLDESQALLMATGNAVRALNARADAQQIGRECWSLTELQPSDYDFIWLRVWLKRLDPATLQERATNDASFDTAAGKVRRDEAIGLLLLFWLSETGRRKTVDGELWPCVATGHFDPTVSNEAETQSLLFTQGQPTELLRNLLRAAVNRFHLRHALDQLGTQRWVNTVFLQFGFTHRGLRQRLPDWLDGQPPQTVEALRQDSESFRQLWQDLQALRFKSLSPEQARSKLENSPWLLPEWVDDAMTLATASAITPSEDTPLPESFITQPVLRWHDGGAPHFTCQLVVNPALNLSEAFYDVWIGGRLTERLLQQPNGSYSPAQSRTVVLPFDQPTVIASLVNAKGETVASCDLECWPRDEDVVLYRLPSGARLPDAYAANLSVNSSYALLTAADLTIEPHPNEWQLTDLQQAKLYRLPAGSWPTQLRASLNGELLWTPNLQQTAGVPVWANQVGVFPGDDRDIVWGRKFQIKIIHPPEVSVRYARCRGSAVELKPDGQATTIAGPLIITPELDASQLDIRIGLQKNEQRCSIRRPVKLKVVGAAHLTTEGWQPLNKHSRLTVEQAKRDLFKLAVPANWGTQALNLNQLFLFEGDGVSHRTPRRIGSLGELHGWGAPLRVRQMFNFSPASRSLWVAGSVVNTGIVADAICESLPNGTARLIRLQLHQRIQPDEQYAVWWWDASGKLISLIPKTSDAAEDAWWWVCDLPDDCTEPLAVAVAFAGARLGAWWPERRWIQALSELTMQDARQTAALIRWFHLPLLEPDALAVLRSLIPQHSVAFLRAWLLDEALPEGLETPPCNETWLSALRTLLREWQPDAETARQTLFALAEVDSDEELSDYLIDAAKRLANIDPLLLAKVLRVWQHPHRSILLEQLRRHFAGGPNVNHAKNALLAAAATDLNLAQPFITQGILARATTALTQPNLEPVHENNLALAVRHASLRRLLTLHLLQNL